MRAAHCTATNEGESVTGTSAAKKTPLLVSAATGKGVPEALKALVEVIGEAPVSDKAKKVAEREPEAEAWTPLPR